MAARPNFETVLILLIFSQSVLCAEKSSKTVNDGLINTLTTGVKFAKDFLGSESVALKVAEFVVRAFQPRKHPTRPTNNDYDENTQNNDNYFQNDKDSDYEEDRHSESQAVDPLRHLVRLFGLQTPQMSAVAVNALLFVAQMISTFLSGPQKPGRPNKTGDPASWILNKNSRKLQELISTAKNESLPDMIEDIISNQGTEEETSCIKLLVCKITPYITKMQKTVFEENIDKKNENKETHRGASIMYRHLPEAKEIDLRSDTCEKKYPLCDLKK